MLDAELAGSTQPRPWPTRARRAAGDVMRFLRHAAHRQDAYAEWRRRLGGEPALPEGSIERVLVLCYGNVCRSPFAERLLAARGSWLEVDSAGLHAGDENPAEPFARQVAPQHGIDLESHRSKRVTPSHLERAQLVLVMTGSQAAEVRALSPEAGARTRLLGDFLPAPPHFLMDPWGHEEGVFVESFRRIERATERLSQRLRDAR